MKGAHIRRKIKQKHGFVAKSMDKLNRDGIIADPQYNNPTVQDIKEKLGNYDFGSAPADDGIRRKKRAPITLENEMTSDYPGHLFYYLWFEFESSDGHNYVNYDEYLLNKD